MCCDARAVFDPASQWFFVIAQEQAVQILVGTNLVFQPATVAAPQPPGNTAYGAFILRSNTVTLMAVTNVLGNPGLTSTNFTVNNVGNNADPLRNSPQAGTSNRILNGVAMASDAFWHDGDLWFCHTGISSNSPAWSSTIIGCGPEGFPMARRR